MTGENPAHVPAHRHRPRRRRHSRQYLRLQETYREPTPTGGSRHRQQVLANLDRVDLLRPHAARLYELLIGEPPAAAPDTVQAWDWGPLLVLRALWDDHLHLDRILRRLGRCPRDPIGRSLAERTFALVANRLLDPSSEHGLAPWLESAYVCDDRGRRWLPQWRDDAVRRASKSPRVRVAWAWLDGWYRTLDRLLACQHNLEVELFTHLRTLFEMDAELALYDITSTYCEGAGPPGWAKHGPARDPRPRNRQVVVGLVLIAGWPIAHHVLAGDRQDATTVAEGVRDLRARFGLKRIVFVGDRGRVDAEVRRALEAEECGYRLGLPRRRNAAVAAMLEQASRTPLAEWTVVPGPGAPDPQRETRVLEVACPQAGRRWFAVHAQERLAWEQQQRRRERERLRAGLERLQARVEQGRLKRESAIAAAAERLLQKHPGRRLFQVEIGPGQFAFRASARAAGEEAGEGQYCLETTEAGLSAVEAVQESKRLGEVESCFAQLKDGIAMRPIWHRTERRVKGHILVATLALLQRMLDRRLREAGEDLSAHAALRALQTVKLVEFEAEEGGQQRLVTAGSAHARQVLRALHLKRRPPPTASRAPKTPAEEASVVTN